MHPAASFSRFGGLRLDIPLDEVGGEDAIDCLDVDWPNRDPGALMTRMGAKKFNTAVQTYDSLFPHSNSKLLTRRGSTFVALNSAGEEAKTAAGLSGTLRFARMGTPTASYTYIASSSEGTIRRYDGTNFAEPKATVDGVGEKAMPTNARGLATWPEGDNRLVVAGPSTGPNAATSSASHVWFSEPGNAEAYESTAYVQLSPGDGEEINEICYWSGYIFVFKETKLYIFYGVETDTEGKPEFNFRTVELGTRMRVHLMPAVSPATDAVYFKSNDGVWATSGGLPTSVSSQLEALRSSAKIPGPASETFGAEERWKSNFEAVTYWDGRLYIPGTLTMLVYDIVHRSWLVWSGNNLTGLVPWSAGSSFNQYLFSVTEAGTIYKYETALNTDASVTMNPRWQSGLYNLGSDDEKTLEMAKMWGIGTVNLKVARDFGALGAATEFALGTSPAVGQRLKNKTQTATFFSHQISGTAPWSVQRMTRYMASVREPGTKTR